MTAPPTPPPGAGDPAADHVPVPAGGHGVIMVRRREGSCTEGPLRDFEKVILYLHRQREAESERLRGREVLLATLRPKLADCERALARERAENARLREAIERHDAITPCACCGVKLAWRFAGDGTSCREALTGLAHACPVGADDFRAGRFPAGTYRHAERRALAAEAERDRLREALGRVADTLIRPGTSALDDANEAYRLAREALRAPEMEGRNP